MMRNILCRKSAALFIGLSVLAFPLTSEAQFLDKLTKGLEKVNKSLKKVDSLTSPKDKQKEKQSNTSQTAQASQSKPRSLDYPVVSQGFKHPFVTEETFYMTVPNLYDDTVSDVYEGVFTVKQGYLYSFWTIDGDCLYGPEWKTKYTSDPPRFDSGVAVAIHNEKKVNGKDVYSLLYLDGSVKQLDPNWTSVSQFYDGVALVEQTVNYDKTYFFINPRGEKIFPTLSLSLRQSLIPCVLSVMVSEPCVSKGRLLISIRSGDLSAPKGRWLFRQSIIRLVISGADTAG